MSKKFRYYINMLVKWYIDAKLDFTQNKNGCAVSFDIYASCK